MVLKYRIKYILYLYLILKFKFNNKLIGFLKSIHILYSMRKIKKSIKLKLLIMREIMLDGKILTLKQLFHKLNTLKI